MAEQRQKKDLGKINSSTTKTKGLGRTRRPEKVPNFNQLAIEKAINGPYNSSIVFGKDRNGTATTDFSLKGYTQAGALDLVVGRASGLSVTGSTNPETGREEILFVNPDFHGDAARIYISQKSDIDSMIGRNPRNANQIINFSPENDISSFGKSSVFIISDHTRIMARERLVLSTQYLGFNALNGPLQTGGVEIIAGNIQDKDHFSLQPMVKGDNLDLCLTDMIEYVRAIASFVDKFVNYQLKFNDVVADHEHTLTIWPPQTYPPMQIFRDQMGLQSANMYSATLDLKSYVGQKILYLNGKYLTPNGEKYINSYLNKVN